MAPVRVGWLVKCNFASSSTQLSGDTNRHFETKNNLLGKGNIEKRKVG